MEPISATYPDLTTLEPTPIEDFRRTMIERFANCLTGDFERGARVARYRYPRVIIGINLVVNCDLDDLSKQVEYTLNTTTAQHPQAKLRATYKVVLNVVNGQLCFTACAQSA